MRITFVVFTAALLSFAGAADNQFLSTWKAPGA